MKQSSVCLMMSLSHLQRHLPGPGVRHCLLTIDDAGVAAHLGGNGGGSAAWEDERRQTLKDHPAVLTSHSAEKTVILFDSTWLNCDWLQWHSLYTHSLGWAPCWWALGFVDRSIKHIKKKTWNILSHEAAAWISNQNPSLTGVCSPLTLWLHVWKACWLLDEALNELCLILSADSLYSQRPQTVLTQTECVLCVSHHRRHWRRRGRRQSRGRPCWRWWWGAEGQSRCFIPGLCRVPANQSARQFV